MHSKGHHEQNKKKQLTEWEKIPANDMSNKRLVIGQVTEKEGPCGISGFWLEVGAGV